MSVQDLPSDLQTTPEPDERVIRRLVRALDYAEGFWLGFAKSNTPAQRRRLVALCRDLLEPLKIRVLEIELAEPVTDLLPVLRERLAQEHAANEGNVQPNEVLEPASGASVPGRPKLAIFVHGLEHSIPSREAYPPLLSSLNLKRELFRQEVPHPLLLWLPDYALTALARKAPDFWAWRSGLYEFAPERVLADRSLEAVRGEAVHITESLSEDAKRERLVMLKGLLDDYRELGNSQREQKAQASILNEIGIVLHTLGEWDDAKNWFERSIELARKLKDDYREAAALHNLARIMRNQARLEEARQLLNESLEIEKRLGNRIGVALTISELGNISLDQRQFSEAKALFKDALETFRDSGDQVHTANMLDFLGRVAQQVGEVEEARRLYSESLEIERMLGDWGDVAVTLYQLGVLTQGQGNLKEAIHLLNESLNISKRLGDKHGVASTLCQLGLVAANEGDDAEAARLLRESLSIFESLGSPNAQIVRRNLAFVT